MKFFIDSADVKEIREAHDLGLVDGVTTNPSLIAKSGRKLKDVIKEIVSIVNGPISAEVISLDAPGMIKEGKELAKIHKNIVVKLPMTPEGLKATYALTALKIKTNVTLIFTSMQALLAAKAGATYVSPFVGRLDDISQDGMQLIRDCSTIFRSHKIETNVLAASLRHPLHVTGAALAGADVATMPLAVILQCLKHPLTDAGFKRFTDDWKASGLSIFEMARAGD